MRCAESHIIIELYGEQPATQLIQMADDGKTRPQSLYGKVVATGSFVAKDEIDNGDLVVCGADHGNCFSMGIKKYKRIKEDQYWLAFEDTPENRELVKSVKAL